jgi:hypothetical protein
MRDASSGYFFAPWKSAMRSQNGSERPHDIAVLILVVPAHERAIRPKPERGDPSRIEREESVFPNRRLDPGEPWVGIRQGLLDSPLDHLALSLPSDRASQAEWLSDRDGAG